MELIRRIYAKAELLDWNKTKLARVLGTKDSTICNYKSGLFNISKSRVKQYEMFDKHLDLLFNIKADAIEGNTESILDRIDTYIKEMD